MSDAAAPTAHDDKTAVTSPKPATVPTPDKGKGKASEEHAMEEDDDDDDDEEDDDDEAEDEEDEVMEEDEPVDTSVILPPGTRRSTRAKVDYSSAEAIEKAGVAKTDDDELEHEDSFTMKED
ncbi:hypothetical protein FRB93_004226 [Tulasnella sp. JGI-2019a]|nr:hypothetical protein FRB93_004226 [Tulasnella sp. JGI-2019a]